VFTVPQHLERLFLDPLTLSRPNYPTTIEIGPGQTLGIAHLVWNAPMASRIEIHVGSPTGPLFTVGRSQGSADTALWVTDGMTFYLQDRTDGRPLDYFGTLAVLPVHLETMQNQTPKTHALASFFLDPQTNDPNNPTTIEIGPGQNLGIAHLVWNAPTASQIEIHVGSPAGPLFATGGPQGSANTDLWVTDGMVFYLQNRINGHTLDSLGTLAILRVHLEMVHNQTRPIHALASFFLDPRTNDPNTPTLIGIRPGETLGIAHLVWFAPTASRIEIHVGSPAGPLFAAGGSQGSAETGLWVTDGMTFYLQDHSNGHSPDSVGTLATLSVHLEPIQNQTPKTRALASSFLDAQTSEPNNPTRIDEPGQALGIAHLVRNAPMTSSLNIHVGPRSLCSPPGVLKGSDDTDFWVTDGTASYRKIAQTAPR
jgi:hypothetical protein